jgi:hypothetical protein
MVMFDKNYMLEKIINFETIWACLNLFTGSQMLLTEGALCDVSGLSLSNSSAFKKFCGSLKAYFIW